MEDFLDEGRVELDQFGQSSQDVLLGKAVEDGDEEADVGDALGVQALNTANQFRRGWIYSQQQQRRLDFFSSTT